VGKNKALVGAGVLVALGVVVAIVGNRVIGLIVVVAALVLGFIAVRQGSSERAGFLEPESDEDYDVGAGTTTTFAEPVEALPTWQPEPLATWSPPEELVATEVEALPSFEEFESLRSMDSMDEGEFMTEVERLDELAEDGGFEEFEYETEVEEPAPAKSGSLFSAPAPIREIEDVHSDEDILRASAATSLNVAPASGGNTELAKLLAKVQSRLAAYE
jgi:hypothetical protein